MGTHTGQTRADAALTGEQPSNFCVAGTVYLGLWGTVDGLESKGLCVGLWNLKNVTPHMASSLRPANLLPSAFALWAWQGACGALCHTLTDRQSGWWLW